MSSGEACSPSASERPTPAPHRPGRRPLAAKRAQTELHGARQGILGAHLGDVRGHRRDLAARADALQEPQEHQQRETQAAPDGAILVGGQ